jgi:hypothetical protein
VHGCGRREVGREVGERRHHEAPLPQARVGHHEVGLVDHQVADEQHVDVERARPPALAPDATGRRLQPPAHPEQVPRRPAGVELHDGVQVRPLPGGAADGGGLVHR